MHASGQKPKGDSTEEHSYYPMRIAGVCVWAGRSWRELVGGFGDQRSPHFDRPKVQPMCLCRQKLLWMFPGVKFGQIPGNWCDVGKLLGS